MGRKVTGADLIETHRSLNFRGDQLATDIGGLIARRVGLTLEPAVVRLGGAFNPPWPGQGDKLPQSVSSGVPLRALVHSDFYALPAKVPHGPIANARLLLNFTTIWKLVGAHIAHQYVPLLARAGVLPCTQFALHPSSSVVGLLRVLHDYIWFRSFRRQRVCLVVDDVRHAYRSAVHDTLRWLLRLAGFPDAVVELLLLATTEATVHMGGSSGVTEALALLLPGVAQGCPASAMPICAVAEVRAFLALLRMPPCWGPGWPFNQVGYMDDTTWCIDSESNLPLFAANLQRAGLKTNLFPSGPKQPLVGAAREGL